VGPMGSGEGNTNITIAQISYALTVVRGPQLAGGGKRCGPHGEAARAAPISL
jgi:hypothetical protein